MILKFIRIPPNPYHNITHVIDVTQAVNFMIRKCNFLEIAKLTPLEILSMYMAAIIHDFEHP